MWPGTKNHCQWIGYALAEIIVSEKELWSRNKGHPYEQLTLRAKPDVGEHNTTVGLSYVLFQDLRVWVVNRLEPFAKF
jgi:hypothetical protein